MPQTDDVRKDLSTLVDHARVKGRTDTAEIARRALERIIELELAQHVREKFAEEPIRIAIGELLHEQVPLLQRRGIDGRLSPLTLTRAHLLAQSILGGILRDPARAPEVMALVGDVEESWVVEFMDVDAEEHRGCMVRELQDGDHVWVCKPNGEGE